MCEMNIRAIGFGKSLFGNLKYSKACVTRRPDSTLKEAMSLSSGEMKPEAQHRGFGLGRCLGERHKAETRVQRKLPFLAMS